MARILASEVPQVSATLPKDPNAIATFLVDANNYVAYVEDHFLGKLLLQRDDIRYKIDAIESAMKIRREEFLGKNLESIPKEYQKTVSLVTQYVDYREFSDQTKEANDALIALKSELSSVQSKIIAWQLVKEQYERSISTGTMVLAWAKASLKLGGQY